MKQRKLYIWRARSAFIPGIFCASLLIPPPRPFSGSFLLVPMHPTLVPLKKTNTASVDFSFHNQLIKEALGCFRPCAFPIFFYNFLIWGSQVLHSVNRWWVCCFPPPHHQHLCFSAIDVCAVHCHVDLVPQI